jgi:hypothetical protein
MEYPRTVSSDSDADATNHPKENVILLEIEPESKIQKLIYYCKRI